MIQRPCHNSSSRPFEFSGNQPEYPQRQQDSVHNLIKGYDERIVELEDRNEAYLLQIKELEKQIKRLEGTNQPSQKRIRHDGDEKMDVDSAVEAESDSDYDWRRFTLPYLSGAHVTESFSLTTCISGSQMLTATSPQECLVLQWHGNIDFTLRLFMVDVALLVRVDYLGLEYAHEISRINFEDVKEVVHDKKNNKLRVEYWTQQASRRHRHRADYRVQPGDTATWLPTFKDAEGADKVWKLFSALVEHKAYNDRITLRLDYNGLADKEEESPGLLQDSAASESAETNSTLSPPVKPSPAPESELSDFDFFDYFTLPVPIRKRKHSSPSPTPEISALEHTESCKPIDKSIATSNQPTWSFGNPSGTATQAQNTKPATQGRATSVFGTAHSTFNPAEHIFSTSWKNPSSPKTAKQRACKKPLFHTPHNTKGPLLNTRHKKSVPLGTKSLAMTRTGDSPNIS